MDVCGGGGGVGTRPWWLALLACGGAYWPLAFEDKQASVLVRASALLRASTCPWGGNAGCNFCPRRPPLTA